VNQTRFVVGFIGMKKLILISALLLVASNGWAEITNLKCQSYESFDKSVFPYETFPITDKPIKGLSIRKIADQLDINRGVVLKICQSNQV